tara:strand:+ start:965 stop:4102 length:3138 start_codon:yes stop_codon:yes gene_type:complete
MPIRVRDKRTGRIETFADGTSPDVIRASMNALRNQERTEALAEAEPETQTTVPFAQRALPFAMRLGAPLAAGVGAALTAPATFGASLMGMPAAVAAGSGLGEYAAQEYERATGQREDLNPTQIAVQTGLGLIPISKTGQALTLGQRMFRRGVHGTLLGTGAAGATEFAETGEIPSLRTLGTGALIGTAMGAGGGALEARGLRRRGTVARQDQPVTKQAIQDIDQPEVQMKLPLKEFSPPVQRRAVQEVVAGRPAVDPSDTNAVILKAKKPLVQGDPRPKSNLEFGHQSWSRMIRAYWPDSEDQLLMQQTMHNSPEDINAIAFTRKIQYDKELAEVTRIPKKPWEAGTVNPSWWSYAIAREMDQTFSGIKVLQNELAERGGLSAEDYFRLQRMKGRFLVLGNARAGNVGEAARVMRAEQELYKHPEQFKAWIASLKDNPEAMEALSERMQARVKNAIKARKFEGDPEGMWKFLQRESTPTFGDKLRAVFYANLLSSEETSNRNIIGTATSVFSRVPTRITGAAVDWGRTAAGMQPERTMYLSEVKPAFLATFTGMQKGVREMAYAWKHGATSSKVGLSYARAQVGRFDRLHHEFAGGAKNPVNWPSRALLAADSFFRAMAYNQELVGSSWTKAVREVGRKNPAKFQKAYEANLLNKKLQGAAEDSSVEAVFMNQLGGIGRRVQSVVQAIPGAFIILPFIRIAGNLLKSGIQMSPAGFLTPVARGVRGTARQAAQARGAAALGTLALFPLVPMALEGKISGRGPRDRTERARLYREGWRPYSMNVGGKWHDYRLIQPIGVPMAIVANAFEAYRESGQQDEESATDVVADIVMRASSSVLDQSYLSGLSDFFTAMEQGSTDPRRFEEWLARSASGFIPASSQLRSIAKGLDPTIRKPRGPAETVMSGLPVLSERVQPRMTAFGEPVQRLGGEGVGGFFYRKSWPIKSSPEVRDPIADELSRLGVRVGLPSPRLTLPGDMKLTREEETRLMQAKGTRLREAFERFIQNPVYSQLPDNSRRRVLEKMKRKWNTRSNDRFRKSIVRERRGR